MTKVVSIQYPSGGFGHFTHVILSAFCKNFSGKIINYDFGPGGDSHAYPLMLPKYFKAKDYNQKKYNKQLSLITSEYATVLIDSGIEDDSADFRQFISPDVSIRICYNDWSWPLIAKMFYTRCMAAVENAPQTIDHWIAPDQGKWKNLSEPWAIREKFFLYLRDHSFRYTWRANESMLNIPIETFLSYKTLYHTLSQIFNMSDFDSMYDNWYQTNYQHFKFYLDAQDVIKNLHNSKDISHIQDCFTQALIYYYIWIQYQFEVPHNDYAEWFANTDDIVKMLVDHKVIV